MPARALGSTHFLISLTVLTRDMEPGWKRLSRAVSGSWKILPRKASSQMKIGSQPM